MVMARRIVARRRMCGREGGGSGAVDMGAPVHDDQGGLGGGLGCSLEGLELGVRGGSSRGIEKKQS